MAADATTQQRNMRQALDAAAQRRGQPEHSIHWGCNAENARSAGVAIIVRRGLPLEMVSTVRADVDCRFLSMLCCWAGHDFQLVNCYFLSGDAAGQRIFINSCLQTLLAASTVPAMLAGDWNFTSDRRRDCLSTAKGAAHHQDEGIAQCFASLPTVLNDAFRHRHPQREAAGAAPPRGQGHVAVLEGQAGAGHRPQRPRA